jgi:manganese/zinc/iron transport system substrate-binding protein
MPKSLVVPYMRVAIAALITLGLSACATQHARTARPGGQPIRAVATVGMVADIIKNIGGERVTVNTLMGPGVDPHLYKPSLGDVRALDEAEIVFYAGLHLEGRMAELFEKMDESGRATIALGERIDPALLHKPAAFEGNFDPHIWFDVTLWQRAAQRATQALIEFDPPSRALYEANAARYLARLDTLDAYVHAQIATIPPNARVLITAHDAFGYFGARYGVEVRGIQGASTAAEASANDVRALAEFITARKIKAIFVESAVPASTVQAVRAAVRSRGWDVRVGGELFADAMGAAGSPEGSYEGMVRHNVDTIVGALR